MLQMMLTLMLLIKLHIKISIISSIKSTIRMINLTQMQARHAAPEQQQDPKVLKQ